MSSDWVRPFSLSLRTSFLKSGVSRPTSAASSGARRPGLRPISASVLRVQGPYGARGIEAVEPVPERRQLRGVGDRVPERLARVRAGVVQPDPEDRHVGPVRERLAERLHRGGPGASGVRRR